MELKKLWVLVEYSYIDSLVAYSEKFSAAISYPENTTTWGFEDLRLNEIALSPRDTVLKLCLSATG